MNPGEYATTSLPEAAYLLTRGHTLRRIEPLRDRPHVKQIVFASEAAHDAPGYLEDEPVPAKTFARHLANLKANIYPYPTTRRPPDGFIPARLAR